VPCGLDVYQWEEALPFARSSLLGADYGLNDVYVARVGGGFPEPKAKTECEGEACQSPMPAPLAPEVTLSSELSQGPGNVAANRPRRCPKGKRRVKRAGKVRCVKKCFLTRPHQNDLHLSAVRFKPLPRGLRPCKRRP